MNSLVQLLLSGCSHAHTTFPLTPVERKGFKKRTYVCCLDCGKEFHYDWRAMRIGAEIPQEVQPLFGKVVSEEI
jgi:hypothetical protein